MTFHESPQMLPMPRGLVTVDLINERGKVVQREQAENFISLHSQAVAKWWQRMMWGAYNPNEIADSLGNKPTEMPWFPAQHIATWNDATAEDSATEQFIRGDIVSWASRHPIGSPTGKRGVVDITASEFKDAYAKWVFNWTSAQGNGTFQSVGWTRIDEACGYPISQTPTAPISFTNLGNPWGSSGGMPFWWDAATGLWNITEYVSATNQLRLVSVAAAGGATTPIYLLPAAIFSTAYPLGGLARIGNDTVISGSSGNIGYLRRYTSAGAQVWTCTSPGGGGQFFNDITIDGAGVVWTVNTDGKLRSHNAADGVITNTYTLAGGAYGLAYDSADGNFWVHGTLTGVTRALYKVSNTGVVVSSVGPASLRLGPLGTSSTAPYSGTYQVPGSQSRDEYSLGYGGAGTNASFYFARTYTWSPFRTNYTNEPTLAMKDGVLWGAGSNGAWPGGPRLAGPVGTSTTAGVGTLATRSRLSSPVVKDNTKSMKITYQFDFS